MTIRARRYFYFLSLVLFTLVMFGLSSCELLEDPLTSSRFDNSAPETFLSILSQSAIYNHLDSIVCDSLGNCDTVYTYYFEGDSVPPGEVDTLSNALQTVLASTQTMRWWGEDTDGDVIGYFYKWDHEQEWTYTTAEFKAFIIPIRTATDIFGFKVKAMDSDSLVDPSPAELILPIKNTPPAIDFRYQSNPIVTGSTPNITEKTFPTRTFLWTVSDADGLETIDSIFYALDDTSNWIALGAAEKGITLTELVPGTHVFYLKVRDVAGTESEIIHYPDLEDNATPNTWEVQEPVGDVLLVDDFFFDSQNKAMAWYKSVLDTIPGIGSDGYSIWEIGGSLPYSEKDVSATLNYFKHIVWYSATTGPEEYDDAANPINAFLQGGGNMLINVTELVTTATTWFPFDSTATINPNGRLFPGIVLESSISQDLDLKLSKLIPFRVKSFALNDTTILDPIGGPKYTPLYRLPAPGSTDPWTGRPIAAAEFDHRTSTNPGGGKVILFSMPFHDGSTGGAMMEGLGSAGKFISWSLLERFSQ